MIQFKSCAPKACKVALRSDFVENVINKIRMNFPCISQFMVTHDVSRNPAICDLLELPYNEDSGCRPFPSPIKKVFY